MTDNHIPNHHPELIWQTVDNELVIVSPSQGKVRALNGLGSIVWQMINGKQTVGQIRSLLSETYSNVQAETLEADLHAFISDLDSRKLIVWQH